VARDTGETAATLILVGLILEVLGVLVLFWLGLILPFIGGIFIAIAVLGVVWVVLIFIFSYAPASQGDYDTARTPTLVFGILTLITGGLVPGILFLVAYAELGDADDGEGRSPGGVPATQWGPAPGSPGYRPAPVTQPRFATPQTSLIPLPADTKYCPICHQPTLPTAQVCRNCGASLDPNRPAVAPAAPPTTPVRISTFPLATGSKFCSRCGQPTTPGGRFCRNCGSALD
jgi:double zinc ribbon protein